MTCQFSSELVIEHAHLGIYLVSKLHDRIKVISLLLQIVQRNKFSFFSIHSLFVSSFILTAENESFNGPNNLLS